MKKADYESAIIIDNELDMEPIRYNVLDLQCLGIENPLNPFFWKEYLENPMFPWFPKTGEIGDMNAAQQEAFGTTSLAFRTLPFYKVDAQPFLTPSKKTLSSYFMTNFYRVPVSVDIYQLAKIAGIELAFDSSLFLNFSTSEHVFQFAKAMVLIDSSEWKQHFHEYFEAKTCREVFNHAQSLNRAKPGVLKQRGWFHFNPAVMFYALQKKFENPDLQRMLLCTSNRILVENASEDEFWGCGKSGYGENKLGQMLMFLRKSISHNHYASPECPHFHHSGWKCFNCEYCDFCFEPSRPDHSTHERYFS